MNSLAFQPKTASGSGKELSRLLTAAVVNQRFCRLLLSNPERAVNGGYHGEPFRLAREERDRILSIRAKSLADFARQLTDSRNGNGYPASSPNQSYILNSANWDVQG